MNREEVEKCKQIAQTALAQGNPEKAVKFLEKAKRMCPEDNSLDALIAQAQSSEAAGGGAAPDAGFSTPSSSTEGPRQRARATTAPAASGATRTNKDGGKYTTEQMQEVQRILRTKDYYELLGLSKNADDDGVKKAYRKLALKLHPDKNKAPGAEEAFKKVSKAVQCIQDSDKRQQYDRYGDEEHMPQQRRHQHQQDFMTPEDLFAAFFGGGSVHTHQRGHQRQQQPQNQQEDGEGAQRAHLFQMLPVILLVFLTLASNFASKDNGSRFSFQASGHYTSERYSNTLNVNYFVTNDFDQNYHEGTKQMADFERQVEIYYVRQLHSDCDYQEKVMYKKVMIAKRRGSQEELQKARNHPRPACKEIEKVKKRHPTIYRSALYMGGF